MRTTFDIPDESYRRLKIKAVQEGRSVRELVLRSIHRELEGTSAPTARRLKEPILKSHAPGSIRIDNEQIYDLIGFP